MNSKKKVAQRDINYSIKWLNKKASLKVFSRNMRPYTVSMSTYNSELKSKILNKIKSNLWFKNSVS